MKIAVAGGTGLVGKFAVTAAESESVMFFVPAARIKRCHPRVTRVQFSNIRRR